jgi:hypothetical protein
VRHGPQAEPAFWAAERKADGSFLGWFHLRPVGDQPFTFDLGYRLRRATRGRLLVGERVLSDIISHLAVLPTLQARATT